jgi:amino acid transporter/nucleotide-binding universal stress UspA family protein
VIIVSSVMFTFISYWRTAAVVLCDLASTAYYIGGIVEQAIGPAAPWFILAVMVFSYAVRSVYIESCSLFVRGGVYRVVKQAMGGFLAKLSVSALMFDYILTGPTSGVSAGQYIMGLLFQGIKLTSPSLFEALRLDQTNVLKVYRDWGAVLLASAVTIYFFRQNLLGIHESSDKALKIMIATTIMAGIMITWCAVTLLVRGPTNAVPWRPDLRKKYELESITQRDAIALLATNTTSVLASPNGQGPLLSAARLYKGAFWIVPHTDPGEEVWLRNSETGQLLPKRDKDGKPIPKPSEALSKLGIKSQEDPLGLLPKVLPERTINDLRDPRTWSWFRIIGVIGLIIAFGHSILAMSGEETLAQVYREVESPKLPNFKRAAFIVFVYSLVLTAGISFFAVLIIPDAVRMKHYDQNLIGGLARYVLGPPEVKLALEAFVVVVGFLILSGAVNTAIIGSNGVLNRVAEDGVLPDWFLKPHPRYGTTYRVLYLILGLQLSVIWISGGDMILLGEAYAFGVVWSFVFKALAMVVLRFRDRSPREYKVPFNLRIGTVEIPFGLIVIFLILLSTALINFFTKEVATVGGLAFTLVFLTVFLVSEHYHEKRRAGKHHEHIEQFNKQTSPVISPASLALTKPYRKLVSIRSTQNLFMLEKALAETDPETTSVVVMTAKVLPMLDTNGNSLDQADIDTYDQQLMTAVVERAERAGKEVKPLIVPTNNPLHAVLNTAKDLQVQELILGASNKYTADEQLEQIAFYWISLHDGHPAPLTVRILSRERDMYLDLSGGNRIPKISERSARSVAELRAAGVGVDRVLILHDGTPANSDLFLGVLTMLDPKVLLGMVPLVPPGPELGNGHAALQHDEERARQLDRPLRIHALRSRNLLDSATEIVDLARTEQYDLIVLPLPAESPTNPLGHLDQRLTFIVRHAHCRVFLATTPVIPTEVVDTTPSVR